MVNRDLLQKAIDTFPEELAIGVYRTRDGVCCTVGHMYCTAGGEIDRYGILNPSETTMSISDFLMSRYGLPTVTIRDLIRDNDMGGVSEEARRSFMLNRLKGLLVDGD